MTWNKGKLLFYYVVGAPGGLLSLLYLPKLSASQRFTVRNRSFSAPIASLIFKCSDAFFIQMPIIQNSSNLILFKRRECLESQRLHKSIQCHSQQIIVFCWSSKVGNPRFTTPWQERRGSKERNTESIFWLSQYLLFHKSSLKQHNQKRIQSVGPSISVRKIHEFGTV